MPPMSLLIKPSSSLCNMRCTYCFYHDVSEKREVESFGLMDYATIDNVVEKALDAAEESCSFIFQGGEPTLVGIDFFKHFIDVIKSNQKQGVQIMKSIQTNGYNIDDEWAKFFAQNGFLVGLSMDGTKETHDFFRLDAKREGTFKKVLSAAQLLKNHGVEFNILTVVTKQTAKKINGVYQHYLKNELPWMQFIPCLDALGEERGQNPYSLKPREYTQFLKTLFDLWYRDVMQGKFVSVRYFENLLGMVLGLSPECCGMLGHCTTQYVIEADGGVYPCDFYVLDELRLGNINTDEFAQMDKERTQKRFIEQSLRVHEDCAQCRWRALCRGGCKRDREPCIGEDIGKNYYCESYREFFEYTYERLLKVAKMIQQKNRYGG